MKITSLVIQESLFPSYPNKAINLQLLSSGYLSVTIIINGNRYQSEQIIRGEIKGISLRLIPAILYWSFAFENLDLQTFSIVQTGGFPVSDLQNADVGAFDENHVRYKNDGFQLNENGVFFINFSGIPLSDLPPPLFWNSIPCQKLCIKNLHCKPISQF